MKNTIGTLSPIGIGTVLHGDIEIIKPIAMGGFGTVYQALHRRTGQNVAVKVLRVDDEGSPDAVARLEARFRREMALCSKLEHPHLVRLLDCGADKGHLFCIFEYVPGTTLRGFAETNRPMSAQLATSLMSQVLDAIACAHRAGIVHRDIKPENIMVTETGARPLAKVLDFGIGTLLLGARDLEYESLTLADEMLGTPAYSAPEQLRGALPTTESDIYSWGLVFLECLTGTRVMGSAVLAQVFQEQLSPLEVPLPPALARHPLGALLRRALRKDPQRRAGDAGRLLNDLQALQLGDLVGDLVPTDASRRLNAPAEQQTRANWASKQPTQVLKEVTTLCYSVTASHMHRDTLDIEALEALLAEQHSSCQDLAVRYGGYITGTLGDRVMVSFGHPRVSDTDARRAGRTALELTQAIKQRSTVLERQQGVHLDVRVGIHTGPVVATQAGAPGGLSPNLALRLESLAEPGAVLVSEAARKRLEHSLEFESAGQFPISNTAKPLQIHRLLGEHLSGAVQLDSGDDLERPLLGRERELAAMVSDLEACAPGNGGAVLLCGEAGIGKTRLVGAFQQHVACLGQQLPTMRCLPEYRNNALRPVLELFGRQMGLRSSATPEESAARAIGFLNEHTVDTAVAVPLFCSWLGFPMPAGHVALPHAPQQQRALMLDLLEDLLLANDNTGAKLLTLEDLHWADPTTLELMGRLVARTDSRQLYLVMTTRPEGADYLEAPNLRVERLGTLNDADASQLIQGLAANAVVDPIVVQAILERTDGVPLFVEELTRMLLDGVLVKVNDRYMAPDGERLRSIPHTIRDSLAERLDLLGDARETAQLGATIGREFDFDLIAAASKRDEGTLRRDLNSLITSRLVHQRRRLDSDSYVFSHALVRDTAYESMPRGLREHCHASVATALLTCFPARVSNQPGEVARHHAGARSFGNAVQYGIREARQQLAMSHNQEARAACGQVLDWIGELSPGARGGCELDVNGVLIPALMGSYGWADERVRERVTRSRSLLSKAAGTEHHVSTLSSLVLFHHVASNRGEARGLAGDLQQYAEDNADPSARVLAATLLGQCLWIEGDYRGADRQLEEAANFYDPDVHQTHALTLGVDSRAWATLSTAQLRWSQGQPQEATECIERALGWAHELGSVPTLGLAHLYDALVCQYAGDRDATQTASAKGIALTEEFGLPAIEAYARMMHFWSNDDADSARPVLDQLWAMGCRLGLTYYGSLPADVDFRQGRVALALDQIDRCLELCEVLNEHYYEPELHRRRALCLIATKQADTESIKLALARSLKLARHQGMNRSELSSHLVWLAQYGPSPNREARLRELLHLRRPMFDEHDMHALSAHGISP